MQQNRHSPEYSHFVNAISQLD